MNTEQEVREAINKGGVVIVDFMAQWCSPCRMMTPVIEELKKEYEGKATIMTVDIEDENETLTTELKIKAIPVIAFFVDGKLRNKVAGLTPKETIAEMINTAIEMTK